MPDSAMRFESYRSMECSPRSRGSAGAVAGTVVSLVVVLTLLALMAGLQRGRVVGHRGGVDTFFRGRSLFIMLRVHMRYCARNLETR